VYERCETRLRHVDELRHRCGQQLRETLPTMWHVVFTEPGLLPRSRAVKSRDRAIHVACELLSQSIDVHRILEPGGRTIERPELDEHFDGGRFPGIRKQYLNSQPQLVG
jgi:hypothetical protein